MFTFGQHLLQSLSLSNRTGETIKDNTFTGRQAVVLAGKYTNHQVVGDELTVVDVALSNRAQLCTVLDLSTQHITCANVTHTILLNNHVTVGTLS